MATQRRINTQEKTHLDQDDTRSEPKSNISPAVPSYVSTPFSSYHFLNVSTEILTLTSSVIIKLLGFTFAMITLPIGSYFLSVNTIFGGTSPKISHNMLCHGRPVMRSFS